LSAAPFFPGEKFSSVGGGVGRARAENFSPGKNGAALKALKETLEDGERFVFLWGPGGSGKTHLLRAFAGAAGGDARRCVHASVERRLEPAPPDSKPPRSTMFARLDDPGQIALFDLCNRMRGAGGALAASGEAPPARLALRADLRSRLASGIVLQAASLERRGQGPRPLRRTPRTRNRARRRAGPLPPYALRPRHGHADRRARRGRQVFAATQAPDHAALLKEALGLLDAAKR